MFCKTVEQIIVLLIAVNGFVAIHGVGEDRIVGGEDVSIETFPHQVSLQYNNDHFCGGSLLNNRVILTAAHCLQSYESKDLAQLTVRLGTSKLNSGGVQIPFRSFAIHQKYNNITLVFDVALVRMNSRVNFTKSIQPITLARTNPAEGTLVFVTGWGVVENNDTESSNTLKGVQLGFIPRAACGSNHRYNTKVITSTMVCADAGQKGACRGDSGGPLVDLVSKQLLGVVSWGAICGADGYPTVFASVVALRNWIVRSANILSRN